MALKLDEPFRWGGQVATPQSILPIPHEGMAVAAKAATGWQNFYNGENQPLSSVTRSPAKMMREAQATYYANPWIRRAESTVSSKVSGLPWHLEDANADEVDDETPNPALQQLHDLLEKPQAALPPEQRQPGISTWRGLVNITSRHMGLCGPAYWFLDQMDQGGLPLALIYINPARMTADVTRTGNLLGWRLDADDYGQGGTPLRVDQVLPFYLDVPDFGAMTTGLVATAALKARIVTASDVHILSVLGTGGRIAALISPKDGYIEDPDRFAQLERDFRLINEAPDAAKRTSIVRGPIDYHQMGADLRQLGLEQLATLARDDIFAVWGVPPSQAGIPHAAGLNSGSTGQNETEVLMTGPVHDRVVAITEVIQFDLLDRWKVAGISAELEIEEPTYDDQAPAYALASAALSQPLLNNERRKIIGWDPLPDYGPDGEPLGVGIWLPATITPMAQGMDSKGTTDDPFPGAPAPKPKPVPPPSPFGTTIPPVPQLGTGAPPPVPAAKAGGFLGLRHSVDQRVVPQVDKALRKFLDGQRADIMGRLRNATPRQLKDESYWFSATWDKALEKVLRPYYAAITGTVTARTKEMLAAKADFASEVEAYILNHAAERITGINGTTRDAVSRLIRDGLASDLTSQEIASSLEGLPAFDAARAEMVARTESAFAYNSAAISSYREYGVNEVQAIDGDYDEVCADRNGRTFSVDDAFDIEDHPNGTLDWVPVVGKADMIAPVTQPTLPVAAYDGAADMATGFMAAIRSLAEPPTVNVDVHPTPVNIDVHPTPVNVAAPIVNIAQAEAKAAMVMPAPVVNVNVSDLAITKLPDRVTRRQVKRDKGGKITETLEVESDG